METLESSESKPEIRRFRASPEGFCGVVLIQTPFLWAWETGTLHRNTCKSSVGIAILIFLSFTVQSPAQSPRTTHYPPTCLPPLSPILKSLALYP